MRVGEAQQTGVKEVGPPTPTGSSGINSLYQPCELTRTRIRIYLVDINNILVLLLRSLNLLGGTRQNVCDCLLME